MSTPDAAARAKDERDLQMLALYEQGWSFADIAAHVGTTRNAVGAQLSRISQEIGLRRGRVTRAVSAGRRPAATIEQMKEPPAR